LGNADVSTAWAQYLCEPIPILKDHIGLGLPHQSAVKRNLKIYRHGISLASYRALKGGYATVRHDTILDTTVSMLQKTELTFRAEDNESFVHAKGYGGRASQVPIKPNISILINGTWRFYDLKTISAGTTIFKQGQGIEGEALKNRTRQVNTSYYVRARRIDEALGNTRCVDILQRQGRVRRLVIDNRGVINKDLRDLIKLAAKSAAMRNLEVNGASSEHYAEANYKSLFRRMIGVTAVKECAIFIRKSLEMAFLQAKGYSFDNAERTRDYARVRRRAREHRREYEGAFFFGRRQRYG